MIIDDAGDHHHRGYQAPAAVTGTQGAWPAPTTAA